MDLGFCVLQMAKFIPFGVAAVPTLLLVYYEGEYEELCVTMG
jgi:hypothetical protein